MQDVRGSVLSLFTGAGGLDLGLEAAGFDTVACLELDKTCRDTLRKNRKTWTQLPTNDVTVAAKELKPEHLDLEVGELDVIAGGPPCQPFSMAAQWANTGRRGMEDDRAKTVIAMLDLVESFLPKALFIENVAGFLRGEISAAPFITERLTEINKKHGTAYRLDPRVVDASHYGVPQRRNRVIAVAVKDGLPFKWPDPEYRDKPMTAWDAIGHLRQTKLPANQGTWTELLASIPEGGNYLHLTARGEGEELFGYRTRYWSFLLKLAKDQPAWTLPASPGPSTGPFHWNNRPLTALECLLLQTFPRDWKLEGKHRQQIKQAGNATPPLLAEVVGRALYTHLHGEPYDTGELVYLPKKSDRTPPKPVPPKPIPARFREMVGDKDAHPGEGMGPSPREKALNKDEALSLF
ncbi:DNA (cytosine-5)-methyltransferase 1 [Lentzea waywayandensis]|uniref:Cytosine-specific methyltransferase n=1 Tax=Lentzea waywayandensis TaxID=84724 RepID=A0A1I6E234_9PSEU|nr:DNA cytosine methyltransferase [Lentzea waywayandensis]SFR11755.1 DNA (cytosine-5)-methyltransferase 1 [Lentzea waywayandensis]